jgi:hypothetical protein
MPSQRPDFEKTMKSVPQASGEARHAAPMHLPALTNEQRNLLEAYRLGQLDEKRFQERLADDPILLEYVRKICRPTDPSARTH